MSQRGLISLALRVRLPHLHPKINIDLCFQQLYTSCMEKKVYTFPTKGDADSAADIIRAEYGNNVIVYHTQNKVVLFSDAVEAHTAARELL